MVEPNWYPPMPEEQTAPDMGPYRTPGKPEPELSDKERLLRGVRVVAHAIAEFENAGITKEEAVERLHALGVDI